ncbi:hypothetical protein AGOR_G00098800 [Albula goreensis]|uniref:RING finger protein 122 n=2 Tax=Albula TaxID=54908 RepID=A0A8T3DL55_9TELE|nr:hypothetical protein AGOR_G00098800 [Albula goreensis]
MREQGSVYKLSGSCIRHHYEEPRLRQWKPSWDVRSGGAFPPCKKKECFCDDRYLKKSKRIHGQQKEQRRGSLILLRSRAPALPPGEKLPSQSCCSWESDYMHPFQWCNGCLCGLGLQSSEKYCEMTSENIYHLPNAYVMVLGIGLFIFMLSIIFCCYLFSLSRQGTREQYGYNEVVLKGAEKKLSLLGQTCAVCLEEFRTRDELGVCPCSHAFHKKCLVKWLEIRSVCPMCNKPICRLQPEAPQGAEGPQDPEEV